MAEGPFGVPRPFAERDKATPGVSREQAERILQGYVDYLADTFTVPSPTVEVRRDEAWVQIVIDPETVFANYSREHEVINLRESDIKYQYVIHEFAHHVVAKSEDDPDTLMQGLDDPELFEIVNEAEAEKLAKDISKMESVRNNWNELVAKGAGLEAVDVAVR